MKISGVIILDEMDGRKDPWVVKKTKNDYFLALKITEIDGTPVNSTADLYSKLYSHFPDVKVDGASFNHLFTNVTLPNGAKDIAHITLGYFPDFRFNRSTQEDVDMQKVAAARKLVGEEISFEITDADFELVAQFKNALTRVDILKFISASVPVSGVPTVGMNRDVILNLKPGSDTQDLLRALSCKVFGENYYPTNSTGDKLAYHLTVAQSNEMLNELHAARKREKNVEAKPALQMGM